MEELRQGRLYAYIGIFAALAYPYLEMGGYFHRLCYGFARTAKGYDSIWVIVDRLTKSVHFFSVDTRYSAKKYAKLYFDRVVILHGFPLTIVSDRGSVFVSRFWEQL